jgi:Disulfide bond formation protein DsbB
MMPSLRNSHMPAALIAATSALAAAWVIQWYGFEPCVLCLRQRIPYYVGIPLLAAAFAVERLGKEGARKAGGRLLAAALACFAISAILGGHHAGVEQGYWDGPASCVSRTFDTSSLDAFAAQLGATKMISCNTPSFTMLGFSLAWWNLAVSAAVAGILSHRILAGDGRK